MRLLLAEDEQDLSRALCAILKHNNYSVDAVFDGQDALDYGLSENYDGIILDIMMPKKNGIEVLTELRKRGVDTPVLILTAKGEVDDKILGLELGADDYVVKPFEAKEVVARIRAVLRRIISNEEESVNEVNWDKLSIILTNYELKVDGEVVDTPPKEMELLYHLASNPNKVYTRDQLLDQVWGFEYYGDSRTVDVHIATLRDKLGPCGELSETVRGVGYRLGRR